MTTTKDTSIKIKPVGNLLIVKLADVQETTASGIILSKNTQKREQICEVVAIGCDIDLVKVGDRILLENGQWRKLAHDSLPQDGDYAMAKQEHIIGIFDES